MSRLPRLLVRALLVLGLMVPVTVRVTADDHMRTGGQYQEPYPYGTPGSVIRLDQRYHPGDTNVNCSYIYMSCHAGDVIINPTQTDVDVVIPPSLNLTWDQFRGSPSISWPGTNSPPSAGPRISFISFSNSKTIKLRLSSSFTPISDNYNLGNLGFSNIGLALSTPCGPFSLGTNIIWNPGGGQTVIPHTDDATIRIAEYCTAGPGGGFPFNQVISPGTTVTMDPIMVTESSNASNGGIWATQGGLSDYGIRITIPAGLGVTFANVGGITCAGSAVSAGHVAANPAVVYEDSFRTVRIPVSSDFGASNAVTISNLQLTTSGAASDQTFNLNIRTGPRANINDLTVPGSSRPTKQIVGLPVMTSAAPNQVFTVGDPSTTANAITIIDAAGSPKITSADDIRIIIPNGFNMTFDTSVTSVTTSGTAVPAKMPNPTNGVTYEDYVGAPGNKVARIPVAANFAGNENVTISGLKFMNFTDASGTSNLQLECVSSRVGVEATDVRTIAIGKPTISSAGDQVFVTPPPNPMALLTITDDLANPRIGTSVGRVSQLRIVIPATFNMTWAGGTPATVSGKLNAAVSYAGGNKTLILTANANFAAGETATVQGLNFTTGAASLPDNLELWMSATGAGPTALDDKIIAIGGVPTMTSTTNQEFTVNDPSTIGNSIILQDAASPSFQAGNTLQVIIPAGLNMDFNTAFIPTVALGAGTGAVGARSFPDAKTLNIPITTDFSGNQTLTLSNIRYTNFLLASSPTAMQLKVTVGGPPATTDNRTKAIGAPTIASAASQVFGTLDPSTLAANIVVTDDATTPRIKIGTDIRVRIPSTFNMEWDTTVLPTLTLGATGTGTINATASFPTNKIMLITVTGDFTGGRSVTIAGARFRNFTAVSATDNLELEVNNTGSAIPNAFDTQTIKIGSRPTITNISTRDLSGNGSLDTLILTFSEAINASTTSVTQGLGFQVTGYTIATGNAVGNTLAFGLIETGTPDTGATPVVSYDPIVGNLVDADDSLKLSQTVLVATADGARPTIVGFAANDTDGDGRLNQVTFQFSETLQPGQEDIGDWTLIDADGQTDLLSGLTNSAVSISGTYVTITLADTSGTLGTPRYQYSSNGLGGVIQDPAGNLTLVITNNSAPVANAGPDQSVIPSLVTLDASASFDPDHQPVTYSWTQTGGPFSVLPGGITTAKTTFFSVDPGVYTFQVDVSDGLATRSDSVNVTILNIAPTALAVLNQVMQAGSTSRIVATLSSDINGNNDILPDPLGYVWAQVSGPPATTSPLGDRFLDVTPSVAGVYVYEVTVTDTVGNTSKSQVTIRAFDPVAVPPLAVPTADAGPDQVHATGTPVTLDGRLSTSPIPARTLNYAWTGPVTLTGANTSTPTFTPTVAGVYTFQLTVTDPAGPGVDSVADSVSVFVFDPANKPPAALASKLTPTGIPVVGDLVTLDSTGSLDPEGKPLDFVWSQVEGPAAILSRYNAPQTTFTPVTPGTYAFQLIVTDGVQPSPPVTTRFLVLRNSGDIPPTVTAVLTTATLTNGHVDMAAAPIRVSATGLSGSESDVYWEQIEGPAVFLDSGFFLPWYGTFVDFNPPIPGRYVFRVNALRFFDLQLAQSTVEVIVDSAGNTAPTANAGTDQTGTAGEVLTLDGSGSSIDTTRYYWTQLAGPPAELTNPFAASPSFTPPAAGTYVFSLKVSDGSATGTNDSVVFTVSAAPITVGPKSSSGGCGLSIEPLLLLGVLALVRRRIRR